MNIHAPSTPVQNGKKQSSKRTNAEGVGGRRGRKREREGEREREREKERERGIERERVPGDATVVRYIVLEDGFGFVFQAETAFDVFTAPCT